MWKRIKVFPYGEAVLWMLFAACALGALIEGGERAGTVAGIAALAAIGVRATRPERPGTGGDV